MGNLVGGLIEFVERKNELEIWQVWLNKVYDEISYPEFKENIFTQMRKEKGMNKRERELQVTKSQSILNNFKPPD